MFQMEGRACVKDGDREGLDFPRTERSSVWLKHLKYLDIFFLFF